MKIIDNLSFKVVFELLKKDKLFDFKCILRLTYRCIKLYNIFMSKIEGGHTDETKKYC